MKDVCIEKMPFPMMMKTRHKMLKKQENLYVSPKVKTVEIKAQAIICQSGGINSMAIDEEDGGESFS